MSAEALFWNPQDTEAQLAVVHSAADVDDLAGGLLASYESAHSDFLPGIELRRGDGPEGLSVALAPFGWALIHTDANLDQHCTTEQGQVESGSADVKWEEPTSVPRNWFIAKEQANLAVAQWLVDGSLAAEVTWSDQCS